MPYIESNRRLYLDENPWGAETPGELNYVITKLILYYLPPSPRYGDYNSVVGVLESAKMELYRRAISKYEDLKTEQHGDVYYSELPKVCLNRKD